jgi:hypothetical protein
MPPNLVLLSPAKLLPECHSLGMKGGWVWAVANEMPRLRSRLVCVARGCLKSSYHTDGAHDYVQSFNIMQTLL